MTIETPSPGDRSYLAHDGDVAFVVDPQRDIDRVLAVAEEAGVRITDVFETHLHNDYVTGGSALARRLGARYHVNAEDEVSFDRQSIRDGDVVEISPTMRVRAIATPGHTFTHLSYAMETVTDSGATASAVFTGGSLLFGATGRPDLLGRGHTGALVRHQFASIHRLADELPEHAEVMPTHGFGSFCSSGSTGGSTEIDHRSGEAQQPRAHPGPGSSGSPTPLPARMPTRPTTSTCPQPTLPDRTRPT
uniref:MBL fold metallo-hydrolase n=1 Tax=Janibacter limosus TaxID=53458 RepID=A0AC61U590_9MICO|nr:MBL fold metallo-hydrolase [Janibacter limosus]